MDYRGITGSFNINSFNTTINDDKAQVFQWLSSLEPQKRHQHLRETRLAGVGQWIFQTDEFQRWNMGEDGSAHSVLFCRGDPGVGKTHISSLMIDHFYGSGPDTGVAGLYCDYLDKKEQTTSNMLGAVLKQLVGGRNIPEDIRNAFEKARNHVGGVRPQAPELVNMLKTVVEQRQRVVICIDGLDESLPAYRTGLLTSLRAIVQEMPNVRLFLTGRPFISSEVEKYFPTVDTISVSPTKEDTVIFLRMKLDGDLEPDAMDEGLRADIMEIIPKTISEIFLLVSLSIEAILAEPTIHRRKGKLKQMSKGQDVGEVYTSTFERIKGQENSRSRLGMDAIMWIAYSERPLRPDELCQALGVEVGSEDLSNDNAPNIRTIMRCGLGLITVDSSLSTVRLVHFTLQEYILANPTLFQSPHSVISEVCLTYLNLAYIRGLSPILSSPPPDAPFLEYASCYWGAHARRETSERAIPLALKLLGRFDIHISCKILLLKEISWERPFDTYGSPIGFTGLHGGAFLGVLEPMVSSTDIKKWDLNATDIHCNTALAWAARKGHDRDVKVLLEQVGLCPDIADNKGRTPLSWASQCGHGEIVKMLLERSDVNPSAPNASGWTPFAFAASYGREKIVKMLLRQKNVNPDAADCDWRTPLSLAAEDQHGEVVKVLLQRSDINPNTADKSGFTPLLWAVFTEHQGIVEMLLRRDDVNPSAPDKDGRTPLSFAAQYGNQVIAGMLLENGNVNPDAPDKSGRTPLSWAAQRWEVEIVRSLLKRNDVNPNTTDERGRTPFSWAATGRVDSDDVDPDAEGECDREYYTWDTENQCRRTAEILLEQSDVNPDISDKNGRTTLSWAASYGHLEIVKLLLGRNDVNPDTPDKKGRSPLSWAIIYGHADVVKTLLERSDVNPDAVDESGRTPLFWAAEDFGLEMVKTLLRRDDVNPDRADEKGQTPLLWAAENYEVEIMETLLKRDDVNPDRADERGRTPLSWACSHGLAEIVEILLERNDVILDAADKSGRTPLSWASEGGDSDIVDMLLQRGDVNPETADKSGWTPLIWAVFYEREEIVDMLLQRKNINLTKEDNGGLIPSSSGAISGSEEIVGTLLELNDISSDPTDENSGTLFPLATDNGDEGVVDMLFSWENLNRDGANQIPGTTFQWAAGGVLGGTADMILEQNDLTPYPADATGLIPFPWPVENEYAGVVQPLEGPHNFIAKGTLRGELSEPHEPESPEFPEPPLKRIRMI